MRFTIAGRDDAPGCELAQPDFAKEVANRNVIFRIPDAGVRRRADRADHRRHDPLEPLARFIRESALDQRAGQPQRQRRHDLALRLEGAEPVAAALLRRGLQRRDGDHQRAVPERARPDAFVPVRQRTTCRTRTADDAATRLAAALAATNAIGNFGNFQRFLAPPKPDPDTPGGFNSINRGKGLFSSIGCAHCHTPSLRTGNSTVEALRFKMRICFPT